MKKVLLATATVLLFPLTSFAQQNNVGECGWGSKVFSGQRGIAPQILAVTTNGTSGNQTFAITSGTSGCTQDGVVRSAWKTAMFIDGNRTKLARDMAVGHGESLDALAQLIGVEQSDRVAFNAMAKDNFSQLFSSEEATTQDVVASLKQALKSTPELARYSANI